MTALRFKKYIDNVLQKSIIKVVYCDIPGTILVTAHPSKVNVVVISEETGPSIIPAVSASAAPPLNPRKFAQYYISP